MTYCGIAMNPNGMSAGSAELDRGDLLPVDVDELADIWIAASRMGLSTPMAFEHLERTRLYTNGFRVLRRLGDGIDDPEVDSPTG